MGVVDQSVGKAISSPTLSLRAQRMSRAKRGESNLLAAWGLLRRYAPRNDNLRRNGLESPSCGCLWSAVHRRGDCFAAGACREHSLVGGSLGQEIVTYNLFQSL